MQTTGRDLGHLDARALALNAEIAELVADGYPLVWGRDPADTLPAGAEPPPPGTFQPHIRTTWPAGSTATADDYTLPSKLIA